MLGFMSFLSCLLNGCGEDILQSSSLAVLCIKYKRDEGQVKIAFKLKSIMVLHNNYFIIQENGFVDIIGGMSTSCKCIGNIK
jgi:hypothetical protein